jgi:hypothetical protein
MFVIKIFLIYSEDDLCYSLFPCMLIYHKVRKLLAKHDTKILLFYSHSIISIEEIL